MVALKFILSLVLAAHADGSAPACPEIQSSKTVYIQVRETLASNKGILRSVGTLGVQAGLLKGAAHYRILAVEAGQDISALVSAGEYGLISKQSQQTLEKTVVFYNGRAALFETASKWSLLLGRTGLLMGVATELAVHLLFPPKAGNPNGQESSIQALVKDPSLLYYLSEKAACQYLADSPDIRRSFDELNAQIAEARAVLALMDDPGIYGNERERQIWKDGIKDIGVVMIPFSVPK